MILPNNSPSFFFQAEDGIRDLYVTGVQTCALPIFFWIGATHAAKDNAQHERARRQAIELAARHDEPELAIWLRSEERRVGKGGDLGGGRLWTKIDSASRL